METRKQTQLNAGPYWEPIQTSAVHVLCKLFLQKGCIADVRLSSKYAADTQVGKMQRDYPSKDKTTYSVHACVDYYFY